MSDEARITEFQSRVRAFVLESLVLRLAVEVRLSPEGLSVAQSEARLLSWLDEQGRVATEAFGKHFQEPAMTALYAEAVREVIDDLTHQAKDMATLLASERGRYGKA